MIFPSKGDIRADSASSSAWRAARHSGSFPFGYRHIDFGFAGSPFDESALFLSCIIVMCLAARASSPTARPFVFC